MDNDANRITKSPITGLAHTYEAQPVTPIQINLIPSDTETSLAYRYLNDFLEALGAPFDEDDDDESCPLTIIRHSKADIFICDNITKTIFIVPKPVTELTLGTMGGWRYKMFDHSDPMTSDTHRIWSYFLTAIKQRYSRRLNTLELEFHIVNWWLRFEKTITQ